jgi:surface polysaccharide O-acyltransferase-like enzyme
MGEREKRLAWIQAPRAVAAFMVVMVLRNYAFKVPRFAFATFGAIARE